MVIRRRLAALATVSAALALGAGVASASAATGPAPASSQGNPHCPADYTGPTNAATGCPYWVMVRDDPNAGVTVPAFLPGAVWFGPLAYVSGLPPLDIISRG